MADPYAAFASPVGASQSRQALGPRPSPTTMRPGETAAAITPSNIAQGYASADASSAGAARNRFLTEQDKAKSLADEQKAQRSRAALKYNAGYVLHQAGRAMTESGKDWVKNPITRFFNENTGIHGNALMAAMPWTHAGQLRETIEPIKARLAFDTLNQMRLDSPNGASLGNITDNDMKLLAASAGSLNVGQPEERLDRTLIDIRKRYVHLLKLWGYTDQDINEAIANQEPSPVEVNAASSGAAPAQAGAPGRGPAPSGSAVPTTRPDLHDILGVPRPR